jgi:hypothetical protein
MRKKIVIAAVSALACGAIALFAPIYKTQLYCGHCAYRPVLCFLPRSKLSHNRSSWPPVGRVVHPTHHECLDGRAIYELRQIALHQLIHKEKHGAFSASVSELAEANKIDFDHKLLDEYEFTIDWSDEKMSVRANPRAATRISYVMDWRGITHYAFGRPATSTDPVTPLDRGKNAMPGIRLQEEKRTKDQGVDNEAE